MLGGDSFDVFLKHQNLVLTIFYNLPVFFLSFGRIFSDHLDFLFEVIRLLQILSHCFPQIIFALRQRRLNLKHLRGMSWYNLWMLLSESGNLALFASNDLLLAYQHSWRVLFGF